MPLRDLFALPDNHLFFLNAAHDRAHRVHGLAPAELGGFAVHRQIPRRLPYYVLRGGHKRGINSFIESRAAQIPQLGLVEKSVFRETPYGGVDFEPELNRLIFPEFEQRVDSFNR